MCDKNEGWGRIVFIYIFNVYICILLLILWPLAFFKKNKPQLLLYIIFQRNTLSSITQFMCPPKFHLLLQLFTETGPTLSLSLSLCVCVCVCVSLPLFLCLPSLPPERDVKISLQVFFLSVSASSGSNEGKKKYSRNFAKSAVSLSKERKGPTQLFHLFDKFNGFAL